MSVLQANQESEKAKTKEDKLQRKRRDESYIGIT